MHDQLPPLGTVAPASTGAQRPVRRRRRGAVGARHGRTSGVGGRVNGDPVAAVWEVAAPDSPSRAYLPAAAGGDDDAQRLSDDMLRYVKLRRRTMQLAHTLAQRGVDVGRVELFAVRAFHEAMALGR